MTLACFNLCGAQVLVCVNTMGLASNLLFACACTHWSTLSSDVFKQLSLMILMKQWILLSSMGSRGFIPIILILYKHLSKLFDLEQHLNFQDVPITLFCKPSISSVFFSGRKHFLLEIIYVKEISCYLYRTSNLVRFEEALLTLPSVLLCVTYLMRETLRNFLLFFRPLLWFYVPALVTLHCLRCCFTSISCFI